MAGRVWALALCWALEAWQREAGCRVGPGQTLFWAACLDKLLLWALYSLSAKWMWEQFPGYCPEMEPVQARSKPPVQEGLWWTVFFHLTLVCLELIKCFHICYLYFYLENNFMGSGLWNVRIELDHRVTAKEPSLVPRCSWRAALVSISWPEVSPRHPLVPSPPAPMHVPLPP